ncbi:IclR family transcriptional regulator [Irregularibacter muris]|uniref:IclR family transcriptional regulator n=1 Tax=Irregularibacter muris TaxID=1796619 RepID=UPI004032F65C
MKGEMNDIVNVCNEVCQLGILIDHDVFYLAKVDSEQPINLVSTVGSKLPAYATALGKALLSGHTNEEIKNYYKNKLKPITSHTITNLDKLLDQIEKIRSEEIAYEWEEVNKDTGCLATPLRKKGRVIAAISVSFPLYRISEEKLDLIRKVLQEKRIVMEQLISQLDLEF